MFNNILTRKSLNGVGKIIFSSIALSLFYSVTLGEMFLILSNGVQIRDFGNENTWLGLIVGFAMFFWFVPISFFPFLIWIQRTGKRNLIFYGSILWLVIAIFIIFSLSILKTNTVLHKWPFSWILLTIIGLFVIGFIPNRKILNS